MLNSEPRTNPDGASIIKTTPCALLRSWKVKKPIRNAAAPNKIGINTKEITKNTQPNIFLEK